MCPGIFRAENQDIGFVAEHQKVRVKIAAYQFQKYGTLEGTVNMISADSSTPNVDKNAPRAGVEIPALKALVEFQTLQLTAGELKLPLAAGMQSSAEISRARERCWSICCRQCSA